MTDENADRIHELKRRISQWDAEHAHEIQEKRDAHQSLQKTLSFSMRVATLGSIPSIVWILCWVAVTSVSESTTYQIVQSCGALVLFGTILAGAARAGGLAAHWWFRHSVVNERLATFVVALLTDAVLFGWIVFLLNW